jgi:hypothetical protein
MRSWFFKKKTTLPFISSTCLIMFLKISAAGFASALKAD